MSNTLLWILTWGIILSLIASNMQLREDIARMKGTIDSIAKQVGLPDPINDELKETLLKLIFEGKKVKAIQEYRNETGAALLEAKRYIDHLDE